MIGSLRVKYRRSASTVAHRIGGQATTPLAIHFVNSLSRHWFDQEVSQRPNQCIDPVRRITRRARRTAAMGVCGERAHLILEHRERAEMVHPALLVERRDRLCSSDLS